MGVGAPASTPGGVDFDAAGADFVCASGSMTSSVLATTAGPAAVASTDSCPSADGYVAAELPSEADADFENARAKSSHRLNRSSARLARQRARTESSATNSGWSSDTLGGSALR